MTSRLAAYIAEGRRLSADEREVAALALQHTNESEQAEIDDAWHEEVNRRVGQVLDGDVELVDGEETQRLIRQRIAAPLRT